MNTLYQILGLLGAAFIAWFIYQTIKNQPQQFSRENINKSFYTLGILALILIGFVSLLVLLVRTG